MSNEEKIIQILTDIKSEISRIKSDISEVKSQAKDFRELTEKGLKQTRYELIDNIKNICCKVDTLELTIKDVVSVTAQNAYDIQLIKRKV